MIKVTNISKAFGLFNALKDISFELKKGEVVGFLGPNGAGKTTTMRILTGFLPPTTGTCHVDGISITDDPLSIRKKIGYLPESNPYYSHLEVTEYLEFMGGLRGLSGNILSENLYRVVHICGLEKVIGKKMETLSKGYKQRVGLAQALLHDPEILILDEPTVGLDPNQIIEIRNLIKNIGKNKTILLSSHILSEVEHTCERVLILSEGKIVAQGTPKELIGKSAGVPVYHVTLRGPQERVESSIKQLSGFEMLEFKKSSGENLSYKIILNGKEDRSEDIFKMAVSQNFILSELKRDEINLETVFKELTR